MTEASPLISGFSDPAFADVEEAFRENFAQRQEIGAAVCVYAEGEKVVDLWGDIAMKRASNPGQRIPSF